MPWNQFEHSAVSDTANVAHSVALHTHTRTYAPATLNAMDIANSCIPFTFPNVVLLLAVSKTDWHSASFWIYIFIPLSHQLKSLACARFNSNNVLSLIHGTDELHRQLNTFSDQNLWQNLHNYSLLLLALVELLLVLMLLLLLFVACCFGSCYEFSVSEKFLGSFDVMRFCRCYGIDRNDRN